MSDEAEEKKVPIELTPEQREQLEQDMAGGARPSEFTAEELEERIAPDYM